MRPSISWAVTGWRRCWRCWPNPAAAPVHGGGPPKNLLPGARHLVTTIYFDTPARTHYGAATGDIDHNVKIRAKEYYDLHPSLAELATDPADIFRYQPWIWFEMKRRDGARTLKHRFRLPKLDVPACLNGGQVVPEALALPATGVIPADSERAGIREIVAYCRALGGPWPPPVWSTTAGCRGRSRRVTCA